jgi:hypothetical protein
MDILYSWLDSQRSAHVLWKPILALLALVGFVVSAWMAQPGRALEVSTREVAGSNPAPRAHARVAQLSEQGDKPRVAGENPAPCTNRQGWASLVCRGPPLRYQSSVLASTLRLSSKSIRLDPSSGMLAPSFSVIPEDHPFCRATSTGLIAAPACCAPAVERFPARARALASPLC